MKSIYLTFRIGKYLMLLTASILLFASCKKTETIDTTGFQIYYMDMTDIGPSMAGNIDAPSYIGSEPSNFKIDKITLNDTIYNEKKQDNFEIDEDKGNIKIRNTANLPVGIYKLTISCDAGGENHVFSDIVKINMMKPLPKGIKVVPNQLDLKYTDVLNPSDTVDLATAQVTVNDSDYVPIERYEIAKSDSSKYFDINQDGEISVIKGDSTLLPGKYVLSLKIKTGASEGIVENAVIINITSKPLSLSYKPDSGLIEEESAREPQTTFTGNHPLFIGSRDDINYSIERVVPSTNSIEIDSQTGILSVSPHHGFSAGESYEISVRVKNAYSRNGIVFNDVFKLNVTSYIAPIQNFSYQNTTALQAVAFDVAPDNGFKGDEVKFEFVDLPSALKGKVTLDFQGHIKASKGNTIPLGSYVVKVKATNPKSDPDNPLITSFTLDVKKNPNFFTYIRYGNNLGLSPAEDYANQFRIPVGTPAHTFDSPTPTTDATVPLYFEIDHLHQGSGVLIDHNTGEITDEGNIKENQIGIYMVKAIAGKGTPAEYSVKVPLFIDRPATDAKKAPANGKDVWVDYSPFVFQVNPTTGGESAAPIIHGFSDLSNFTLDYRRSFNYFAFSGELESGGPGKNSSFLQHLWDKYYQSQGKNPNYGSRDPVSYYGNENNLNNPIVYINPDDFKMVVNPNKWIDDGEWADGAFIGQITFDTDGGDPAGGGHLFPIVIWFSTDF